ncbi:MAG: tetratricopeptide repeat protein [Theionarchaea archaeon]|nr:tetratricopeptide repeat protein [Theionarchaea archaeon]
MDTTLEVHISQEGAKYKVRLKSDFGESEGFLHLGSINSRIYNIQEAVEDQEDLEDEFVENLGKKLFEMLFSNTQDILHKCLDQCDHVTIILHMEDPLLNEIPWELCYDLEYDLFLGASAQSSIVRRDQKSAQAFKRIDYPLKVLVIISSPMDLDERGEYQPDPDEIMKLMEPLKSLEDQGMVKVDFLERASVPCIQDSLKKGYDIVHFVGHGFFDSKTKKGYLIIEDAARNSKKLEGRDVAHLFGTNPPQLMMLTACESSPLIPFLLSKKVPAVMGMQYSILKDTAHTFVERFYSLLVKGDSLSEAVSSARNAVRMVKGMGNPGWFTPVVYMRSDTILDINTESPLKIPEKKVVDRYDWITDLIGVETFVGRRKDLWFIEKALFEENLKMVVVTGIGGIGKTALASKFVNRHKDTFKGVFARKIVDPGMSVEELLGFMDSFMVQNGNEHLHEVIGEYDLGLKLYILNNCLDKYLIVLDNFDLLIENHVIADENIERFLKAFLAGDHPGKVLITSRYGFTFRDDKADGLVKYVDVHELSFQYSAQLLENFGVRNIGLKKEIHEKIGGTPQFLEFFMRLSKTRSIEKLLEDVTPVREKIGEWLLNELVGMLSEEELDALKKICVFRLKVDGSGLDIVGISDEMDKLVYVSLVKVDKGYFVHQGVKDYVYALMSDNEKREAHAQAVMYYEMLFEKEKGDLEDILELHYHLVEAGQYEKAGAVAIELVEPFLRWGFWGKLMELLIMTVRTTDGEIRAVGLHNLGIVLQSFGKYGEAEKLYRESLDIAKSIGDTAGIASSLHQLGIIHEVRGEYGEAEKLYRESLDIKKSIGDTAGIAISLHQLGMIHQVRGEYGEAEKLYRESLDIKKSIGDTAGIASSLHQLGRIHEVRGEYGEALAFYIDSLSIFSKLGSPDAEVVIESLIRVKETIGKEQFDNSWKAITNQEVPDFITTYEEQLEDLIQYITYIVENNEHEEIEEAKETLHELLNQCEPDKTQFLQLLLDYISRKDVSQKINELKEPFKSIIQKYLK